MRAFACIIIIAAGARRERAVAPLASQRDGGGRAAGRREGRTTVDSRSGQRGENNWPRKSKKKNCRHPGFYGCEDLSLSEATASCKIEKTVCIDTHRWRADHDVQFCETREREINILCNQTCDISFPLSHEPRCDVGSSMVLIWCTKVKRSGPAVSIAITSVSPYVRPQCWNIFQLFLGDFSSFTVCSR